MSRFFRGLMGIFIKTLAFILILTTLLTSLPISAQSGIAAQAIRDARRDAEREVNKVVWFAGGCCFSGITYAAAVIMTPEIPINRFIGKSPEYVFFYTQEHQRKTRALQTKYTVMGWLVGFAGCIVATAYFSNDENLPPYFR